MDNWDSISTVKPQSQPPAQDWDSISSIKPVAAPATQPQSGGIFSDEKGNVGAGTAAIRGAGDGITFGTQDEILAGLDAAVQPLIPISSNGSSASTWRERYDENLTNQRALLKTGQEQHPIASAAGGVAGALIPAVATMGGSLTGTAAATAAKASLAATSAKSAAIGAAQGAAYGFGSADGDLTDRAKGAATGAAIGGVVGGVAPAAISGLSAVARKVTPSRLLPSPGEVPPVAAAADIPPVTPDANHADVVGSVVNAATSIGRAQARNVDDLAAMVQPDQRVLNAAEQLGVADNLPPEFYSQNPAFKEVAGGVASVPGSAMAVAQNAKVKELGDRADQFITDHGGQIDKARFSDDFRDAGQATLKDLKAASDDLHGQVLGAVPNDTPAYTSNGLSYVNDRLAGLNGDTSLLDPALRRAHRVLTADPDSGKPLVQVAGLSVKDRYAAPARSLSNEADQIVSDLGGSYDKAAFSDLYKKQGQDAIAGLQQQSDALYDNIAKAIPGNVQVPASNAVGYVRGRQAELGGARLLNADQRKTLSVLSPQKITQAKGPLFPGQVETVEIHPNYAAVDQVRKEVGQGYTGIGPFASMERGQLNALYGALSKDQEAAVASAGPQVRDQFQQAKALVAQRKGIEEGLTDATGKDLSGAIGSTLGSSINKLAGGDYQLFDKTIGQIPPELRQQAVATALGDAFSAGKGNGLNIPALAAWHDKLTANPSAMARISAVIPAPYMERISALASNAKTIQGLTSGKIPDPFIRAPGFSTLGSLRGDLAKTIQSGSLTDDQRKVVQGLHDSVLSDQAGIAARHGAGDTFQSAVALDAKHAELDSNLKGLLGDELKGSVSAKLGSAIGQLKDGNTKNFDSVMAQIPKEQQAPALMTTLNDLFTHGARKQHELSVAGFSSVYQGLARHPASMARIEKYMPEGAPAQFHAIGTLATSIADAMSKKIQTGRLNGLLDQFDKKGGFVSRAFDIAKKAGLAELATSALGFHGVGAASVIGSAIAGSIGKQREPIIDAATKMLMSPQFVSATKAMVSSDGAMRANVVAQEKRLMRTMAYRKWENALSSSARARVATVGPLTYLFEPSPKPATAPAQ